MRNCITPEKVLAIGLYRLTHRSAYVSLALAFSVGKTTVIEAVQDIVNTLFDLRHQYVKFPTTEAETAECIATFNQTLSELPLRWTHWTFSVATSSMTLSYRA